MKALFFEYHTPTKSEFQELWERAVFSFDASVLLDLYRYSKESREELLRLFREHRDRIWLTHQSADEFHKNRLKVIAETRKRAADLRIALEALINRAEREYQQHPFVTTELCAAIAAHCKDDLSAIAEAEFKYPNLPSEDPIASELLEIFDGRVGRPYPEAKRKELYAEIEARYGHETPPGYLDRKTKEALRSHGDCILWFQLIDHSKENKQPAILVTRDVKEDWWVREAGKTLFPRPELRREFRERTGGCDFYLYRTEQFIEHAKALKKDAVSEKLLQESRVIAETVEMLRQEAQATSDGAQPSSDPLSHSVKLTSDADGGTERLQVSDSRDQESAEG
ncbi:MAG TPA: PIN domain-containing protein [Bryobacteraceae bacterium]|jgi:hypothetical protein|nr:PIN domain-containing protein [Bryobacteraceae bacterium]